MVLMWLILFIVLLIIEALTINLVSIWFAIGAFFSCITSLFTSNFYIQFLVFIVVSIIVLLITKPFVKKMRKRDIEFTNLDRVIGMIGVVTSDILPLSSGEVMVDGKRWSAISNEKIVAGSKVKIKKIEGVKLIVELIKED